MFFLTAPAVRETEIFTRMPERLRRTGVRSQWADANRGGQPTDSYLEGPVFDATRNLFVTDIPFGRIVRIDPNGEWEQVKTSGTSLSWLPSSTPHTAGRRRVLKATTGA